MIYFNPRKLRKVGGICIRVNKTAMNKTAMNKTETSSPISNAPSGYKCPICLAIQGIENQDTWIKQKDIFYQDALVMGFISSKFIDGNEGHPLIVPVKHFENIYDLPLEYANRIFEIAKKVALALKETRKCDGVTILQNNEWAGDQRAFHYHMHVFPRFSDDMFHQNLMESRVSKPEERIVYAQSLKEYFSGNGNK